MYVSVCVCVIVCGSELMCRLTAWRELILFPPTGEINLLRVARAPNALRKQSGQQQSHNGKLNVATHQLLHIYITHIHTHIHIWQD